MAQYDTNERRAPDSSYTHAIILDFEATCDNRSRPRPQEIIEFPSVLLSLNSLEITDEFQAFTRPFHHPVLSEFCKTFTSISQADVDNARKFPEVLADHGAWLKGHGLNKDNAIMVTCGDWDLGTMLPAQCSVADPPVEMLNPIYTRWHNIKRAYCKVRGKAKAPGMSGMLKELRMELVGHHHRGIDDCRNIASIYRELLRLGAGPEVTASLPASKYPPVTIRLWLDDQVKEVRLDTRSVKKLFGLAGSLFKCQPREIHRRNGRAITEDDDLVSLGHGEELRLILP